MENNSAEQDEIDGGDQYYIDVSPAEAREIAASLILAAETAERQQEGGSDERVA
jgi:hypothetical protein